jgi:hypothetical protein
VVADVRADAKGRVIVGRLQGGEHFKKVLQAGGLAWHHALRPFLLRKLAQHFRHIVSHIPVIQAGSPQDMPDQDIKVKMG